MPADEERKRIFCGLRLPDRVLDELVTWQRRHLSGGRIVPREHLHVTLAFLGSTPAARIPAVVRALREAAAAAGPIELEVTGRAVRETRSVCMLVLRDVRGTVGPLAEDLFGRLEALGVYERERRPWLAHVTVLRFRRRPRLDVPAPALGRFSPSEAAVYHSVLRSGGAQYEIIESVALGG
ncbi:MAG: RNA 2',3'-cyclic phosphodiesterase [Gaiellaceae bacterium]